MKATEIQAKVTGIGLKPAGERDVLRFHVECSADTLAAYRQVRGFEGQVVALSLRGMRQGELALEPPAADQAGADQMGRIHRTERKELRSRLRRLGFTRDRDTGRFVHEFQAAGHTVRAEITVRDGDDHSILVNTPGSGLPAAVLTEERLAHHRLLELARTARDAEGLVNAVMEKDWQRCDCGQPIFWVGVSRDDGPGFCKACGKAYGVLWGSDRDPKREPDLPGVPVSQAEMEELTERAVAGDQAARAALSDEGEGAEDAPAVPEPVELVVSPHVMQLARGSYSADVIMNGKLRKPFEYEGQLYVSMGSGPAAGSEDCFRLVPVGEYRGRVRTYAEVAAEINKLTSAYLQAPAGPAREAARQAGDARRRWFYEGMRGKRGRVEYALAGPKMVLRTPAEEKGEESSSAPDAHAALCDRLLALGLQERGQRYVDHTNTPGAWFQTVDERYRLEVHGIVSMYQRDSSGDYRTVRNNPIATVLAIANQVDGADELIRRLLLPAGDPRGTRPMVVTEERLAEDAAPAADPTPADPHPDITVELERLGFADEGLRDAVDDSAAHRWSSPCGRWQFIVREKGAYIARHRDIDKPGVFRWYTSMKPGPLLKLARAAGDAAGLVMAIVAKTKSDTGIADMTPAAPSSPADPQPCPTLAAHLARLGFAAGEVRPGFGRPHQYWVSPCGQWQLCVTSTGDVVIAARRYYTPEELAAYRGGGDHYADLQAEQVLPLAESAGDAAAFLAAVVELVGEDPQVEEPVKEGEQVEAEQQQEPGPEPEPEQDLEPLCPDCEQLGEKVPLQKVAGREGEGIGGADGMVCPKCHWDNAPYAACPACGYLVAGVGKPCPGCGGALAICDQCGNLLEGGATCGCAASGGEVPEPPAPPALPAPTGPESAVAAARLETTAAPEDFGATANRCALALRLKELGFQQDGDDDDVWAGPLGLEIYLQRNGKADVYLPGGTIPQHHDMAAVLAQARAAKTADELAEALGAPPAPAAEGAAS